MFDGKKCRRKHDPNLKAQFLAKNPPAPPAPPASNGVTQGGEGSGQPQNGQVFMEVDIPADVNPQESQEPQAPLQGMHPFQQHQQNKNNTAFIPEPQPSQISNDTIRKKALNQPSVEQSIRVRRLRWLGHSYHMDSSRLPNKMLSAQPPHGKRPQGKRFLTWRELLRSDFEQLYIKETWHDLVSNHKTWKSTNFDPQKAKSPWQGRLRHRKDGQAQ